MGSTSSFTIAEALSAWVTIQRTGLMAHEQKTDHFLDSMLCFGYDRYVLLDAVNFK